jgi:hypothetical protein
VAKKALLQGVHRLAFKPATFRGHRFGTHSATRVLLQNLKNQAPNPLALSPTETEALTLKLGVF